MNNLRIMNVCAMENKKKKYASCYDWIRFLSCWHTCTHTQDTQLHAGFTKVSTHVRKKFKFWYIFFLFFSFFFVIRKQITTQGELQNDIHTQTYTDTHRENTFGFHCIRLYCIRRLYINFPRNARFRQIIFYRSERKSVL